MEPAITLAYHLKCDPRELAWQSIGNGMIRSKNQVIDNVSEPVSNRIGDQIQFQVYDELVSQETKGVDQ